MDNSVRPNLRYCIIIKVKAIEEGRRKKEEERRKEEEGRRKKEDVTIAVVSLINNFLIVLAVARG
ncbi:hypothetical protein QUB08_15620 [Microcoleus sp. BR0-C5]|uniref:hypothetical protein n=1 Tax=Microcoleus sp. BR0-C5 TaxID=2818713 RepID=UPI002FD33612